MTLPIDRHRSEILAALDEGPVVLTSPTGSGKSTQVPRWCQGDGRGPVLVVEPRRVACRGLAQRVAELEGTPLGQGVGYHVRDERRAGAGTRILFVTPGIALRTLDAVDSFATVILDEFHERSLEVDLLFALLRQRREKGLAVMSATLGDGGRRVAESLRARRVEAPGRSHPVEVGYLQRGSERPSRDGLEARVLDALARARDAPGDVLVFLPGKGEIEACARAVARIPGCRAVALHGGLSLEEQGRVFLPASERKVILATNVAETSLTVPGVGVVIDSGLVRQTRYLRDRGYLTITAIAADSAEQRTGRAGRTGPGVCWRLWGPGAPLDASTRPEIFRESLVPLVLAAAACGSPRLEELPFLDPPPDHAVETARGELQRLGALDPTGSLTPRGERLFGLPLEPVLGRLLIEAETRAGRSGNGGGSALLEDAVDLAAALAARRALFPGRPRFEDWEAASSDGFEGEGGWCDAARAVEALRGIGPAAGEAFPEALAEARRIRARLREAFGLPKGGPDPGRRLDRRSLARCILAADPRSARLRRRRGKHLAWSHGGTEVELGRASAAWNCASEGRGWETASGAPGAVDGSDALLVLDSRAMGQGRDARLIATAALPVPVAWLLEEGLGRDRLGSVRVRNGVVEGEVERVYARRVLASRWDVPRGDLAREAVARLVEEGRLFADAASESRDRFAAARLALRLSRDEQGELVPWRDDLADRCRGLDEASSDSEGPDDAWAAWLRRRLVALGVESGEDLALLEARDILPPELPAPVLAVLDKRYPRSVRLPDAEYRVHYDLGRRQVVLDQVAGRRKDPPSIAFLPRFQGFGIRVRRREASWVLRAAG